MKLDEIRDRVLSFPTIMGISNEMLIINELMAVEHNEIIENEEIFLSIISDVCLSFYDSDYLELTKESEEVFIGFSQWLKGIKSDLGLQLRDNYINNFNITVGDVKRMMAKNN